MPIHNIVVHKLIKEKQQKESDLELADSTLPANDSAEVLMQKIKSVYNGKSSKAWGSFQEDRSIYPFSAYLSNYLDDDDFLSFSIQSIKLLKSEIDRKRPATGGYLLFAHYDNYLMIVMLDDVDGTMITDDLRIQETTHLDMQKLHLAARVNIANWQNDVGKPYLSLIKGANKPDYVIYFKDFIGCDEFSEPKEQTHLLITAVNDYCSDNEFSSDDSKKLKKEIFAYCDKKRKAKEPVELEGLANAVFPESPDDFLEHCRKEDYTLNDSFELDNTELKRLTVISGRGKGFKLSFDVELLGESVHYDRNTGILQFEDLPADLVNDIENFENNRE